jgi:large subunit ribosomal protein L19
MSQFATFKDQLISSGDTIRISQEIAEGDKKRLQLFEGIVIAIKNRGLGKSVTVRKMASNSIGVEKIFPLALPSIKKVEVRRKGQVRRSKLYYLRDRIGKAATRIKEDSSLSRPRSAN